jgi:hypothetical protein
LRKIWYLYDCVAGKHKFEKRAGTTVLAVEGALLGGLEDEGMLLGKCVQLNIIQGKLYERFCAE